MRDGGKARQRGGLFFPRPQNPACKGASARKSAQPLSPGTRLGPYEILAPIGAGGMGEVYRATDIKLARDVAIKVIPQAFVLDADRMAGFTREAQVLASLNHPNIAAIYGVEERALVMELAPGPTLAERIAPGAIPLAEALPPCAADRGSLSLAGDTAIPAPRPRRRLWARCPATRRFW